MALVILFLIALAWFLYQMRRPESVIVSEAPQLAKVDPFADHPMHCKCTHHR